MKLPGIDINARTTDNSTALHGATLGFDHNYLKTTHYNRKIVKLLLYKGVDTTIINNKGENYMKI